jgi:crossover junction endodeoxyribonuclease RuvC
LGFTMNFSVYSVISVVKIFFWRHSIRVLGIDPGFAIIGWAVLQENDIDVIVQGAGTIETPKAMPYSDRLLAIREGIERILKEYTPDEAAIEEIFFSKNAKTAIKVAEARGVTIVTLASQGFAVNEYTPVQVKQAITGHGQASKEQVMKMVRLLFRGQDVPDQDDACDAIAIAYSHMHNMKARIERSHRSQMKGHR